MHTSRLKLILELTLLFVFLPVMTLFPMHRGIKAALLLIGVGYIIVLCLKEEMCSKTLLMQWKTQPYWRPVAYRFLALAISTTFFTWWVDPNSLFVPPAKNPLLWVGVVLLYSVFSVIPQEFLYRTFFFNRFRPILKDDRLLVLTNAAVFSMAHLFYRNVLVLVLTFAGGILFAITYDRTKSLTFTCLEHAIYGSWLFTVGMGEMLGFPMPE